MKRVRALLIFILAAFLMAVLAPYGIAGLNTGDGDWEWSHPEPQGNTILDIDFVDDATGWVVGSGGVVLKTDDGGSNWISQTPDATCTGLVGSGCTLDGVDFLDADTGWAVGGYGTIFRTDDGGDSWTRQALPEPYTYVALNSVSFSDANVGVAVGNGHGFYTTNGGATWTRATGLATGYHYASVQMVSATAAYLAGSDGKIYKTTDGGAGWTQQNSGIASNLTSVFFKDASNGFAIGGARLLRTADGGATWNSNSVTPLAGSMIAIAVAGDNLIAAGEGGVILRRESAGNWSDPLDTLAAELAPVPSGATGRLHAAAVASGSASHAFAGGIGGAIVKTTDGGASWNRIAGGDANDITSSSFVDGATGWIAGDNSMVIRTVNGGRDWVDDNAGMPAGVRIYGLHFLDANTGFAAGVLNNAGVIYKYTNGVWNGMEVPGGTGRLYAVHMTSATEGWAVGRNSMVLRTSDGATWVPANTGIGAGYELNSVDATAATDGWITGQKGACPASCQGIVLKYDPGSGGWAETVLADVKFFSEIDMVDANTGYVVGSGGRIYKTSDGGGAWEPQDSGTSRILASVSFLPDGQTGFVAGGDIYDSRVLKTTDGGATWSTESVGTNLSLNTVSTMPAPAGETPFYAAFAGGGNGAVLRSGWIAPSAVAYPQLAITAMNVYWENLAAYQNRQLSVDLRIVNKGEGAAVSTSATEITATNGVSASTGMPVSLGYIEAGGRADFTAQYLVPGGVSAFRTSIKAQCQDETGGWHYYPQN
ncbi:MAG: hypothetical protein IBX61_09145 [Thermoleophilia bacterium]|nr:hypothetical protein [Thermoleophilia bacterium]